MKDVTEIASDLVSGMSKSDIARKHGVCRKTIYNWLDDEGVKKGLEELKRGMLKATPRAVRNVIKLANELHNGKSCVKTRDLAYKANKTILESAGLVSSGNGGVNVNVQVNTKNVIQPEVFDVVGKYLEDQGNIKFEEEE